MRQGGWWCFAFDWSCQEVSRDDVNDDSCRCLTHVNSCCAVIVLHGRYSDDLRKGPAPPTFQVRRVAGEGLAIDSIAHVQLFLSIHVSSDRLDLASFSLSPMMCIREKKGGRKSRVECGASYPNKRRRRLHFGYSKIPFSRPPPVCVIPNIYHINIISVSPECWTCIKGVHRGVLSFVVPVPFARFGSICKCPECGVSWPCIAIRI
jgi:hypothetical protein